MPKTYKITGVAADRKTRKREAIDATVTFDHPVPKYEVDRAVKDQLYRQGKAAIEINISS